MFLLQYLWMGALLYCCAVSNKMENYTISSYCSRNSWRSIKSAPRQECSDLECLCQKLDPLLSFKVQQTWINTNQITILGHLGSGWLNWDWQWHCFCSEFCLWQWLSHILPANTDHDLYVGFQPILGLCGQVFSELMLQIWWILQ